jgi:hypothetical protein
LIENGIKPTRRIIMDTELVIRDSCGALQKYVDKAKLENVHDYGSALIY